MSFSHSSPLFDQLFITRPKRPMTNGVPGEPFFWIIRPWFLEQIARIAGNHS